LQQLSRRKKSKGDKFDVEIKKFQRRKVFVNESDLLWNLSKLFERYASNCVREKSEETNSIPSIG